MGEETHKYFSVKILHSELLLEFTKLREFIRFLQTHRINTVFKVINDQEEVTHFAVSYKGGLMRQATEGYESLEDFNIATRERYPDAASFYTAHKMGYKNYNEYKIAIEGGIGSYDEFIIMKEKGFVEGYTEWKTIASDGPLAFANPFELYKHAIDKQFENYAEFKKATEKGFESGGIYRAATSKGFVSSADFDFAVQLGIDNANELIIIRKNKIRDRTDYMRFLDLECLKETDCKHDQRVLLTLLSKLPDGRKVSINKLDELFVKSLKEYQYTDTNELPQWFSIGFDGRKSIVDFLTNHTAVKKYGHYDTDGEFFETKSIQSRSVVIDGSNVAFNNAGNTNNAKARIENVILVVEELKKRGFTQITVIVDASLRYRLEDKDRLPELKEMVDYLEAPAEAPADIFILQVVKHEHCLLVSNDIFREWKVQDPWVAQNIDFYRMSFMIKDDKVLLPDLDK